MSEAFVFDAPQFVDFSSPENENIEVYFEKEHEDVVINGFVNGNERDDSERDFDQLFFTPMKATPETSNADRCLQNRLKRSMSLGDFPEEIRQKNHETAQNLSRNQQNCKIALSEDTNKKYVHNNLKKYQSLSKLNLFNKLAEPKYKPEQTKATKKYVPMAEAISKFYFTMPPRFHTKLPKEQPKQETIKQPKQDTIKLTDPQSPNLVSKTRSRPVNVLSREEKEALEAEEVKKYKLKIHPVNSKILRGPDTPVSVEKRPPTKPEPFKLSEAHAKKADSTEKVKVFEFHAQPVPKSLFKPPIKPALPTRSCKLVFSKRLTNNATKCDFQNKNAINEKPVQKPQPLKAHRTEPKPFSFDERDKQLPKKREELVHKVLEEEKKVREFHANPVPKSIFKSPQSKYTSFARSRQGSYDSIRSHQSDETRLNNTSTFKARPAKVLYSKPFEVKKSERTLVEITDFQLNTDRRAREREEFEQKLKVKEEKLAELKKRREEMQLLQEQEEIAKLRKEAEYKAQPIKHFKKLEKVVPKKLTIPISPMLATDDRSKNKENAIEVN